MLWDMDHCVFHGQRPVKNTKSSYESVKIKDPRANNLKTSSQPLILQQIEEPHNKDRKKKKKDRRKYDWDYGRGRRAQKDFIPASGANTINFLANQN